MSGGPSPVAPPGAGDANPTPMPQLTEPSEVIYKTRAVDFFQRRAPIGYQDGNTPSALVPICNVLLLKGLITLNPDAGEVSQQKLPSLEDIKDRFKNKRKSVSSPAVSWVSGKYSSPTELPTSSSAAIKGKKPRASGSGGTPTSQMKPQLPAFQAQVLPAEAKNLLRMMVGRWREMTGPMIKRIIPSVVPNGAECFLLMEIVIEMQNAFLQFQRHTLSDDSQSAPEDLLSIHNVLEKAIKVFAEHIRTSQIPVAADRMFFMRGVAMVQQILLELSS